MQNILKKWYFWLIAILVIAVAATSFILYRESQPVDISKYITIKSYGYNTSGTVELSGKYEQEIKKVLNDKKPKTKQKYIKDVKVTLNKNSGLSNGQKVVATVKTSIKDNPIKSASRTFKVSGLSKIPNIKNLSAVLSSIDSRVRSQFVGNSAYSWDITRNKQVYFISGTLKDTNTNTKKEDSDTPVPKKAFSLLTLYHLQGTGSINEQDDGYVVAGDSNIELKNGEVNLSSLTPAKYYWHFNEGSTDLTVGFLNWMRTFRTEQEVTDWLQTKYPAFIEIQN